MITFEPFPKIGRYSRSIIVTEKIDGTNAQVIIEELSTDQSYPPALTSFAQHEDKFYAVAAASRSRLISPGKDTDNYGFAAWVRENAQELVKLGVGRHFGEWWGQGIQRNYGLKERRFSLFNAGRWLDRLAALSLPSCCHVVPILYHGDFDQAQINATMAKLKVYGSFAAPGFDNPEGIIVFHSGTRTLFKKTFEKDDTGKEAA